jgi:hypothetical protein
VGTNQVMAPLTFMRESLCLNARWRKAKRCGRLAIGGYAHHPYTKAAGPSYRPRKGDDVTIGVVSRVPRAVSRAARAGAITRGVPSYITEFGFQSAPDPFAASLDQQATYLGISERIAYANRSIASYAQYLMLDEPADLSGPALSRYAGFQTGIRLANGRVKPSYAAFRLPLAVKRSGRSASVWGYVRPAVSATTVQVMYRDKGSRTVRPLRTLTTNASGYFTFRASYKTGRRWQLRWTSPTGEAFAGPFVPSY